MPLDVHLDGLTLAVTNVRRSMKFYRDKLGFEIVIDATPDFAMVRVGGKGGGTIGLLALRHAVGKSAKRVTAAMRDCAHLELGTGNLDGLYAALSKRGVPFDGPPHDEPWERTACARDPDGYGLEFSQDRPARPRPAKKRTRA